MKGPAGVTALVLAETVAGGLALLFLTPLWGEVKRGFFKLTGAVLFVLGIASACVSIAVLVAMAGTGEGTRIVALLQLLAGAGFLGAVMDGLLLGHWSLTDRRLI